jgi:hypothetical protein
VADQDPMNSPHIAAERVIRLVNGGRTMAIVAEFRHARARTACLGSEDGADAAQMRRKTLIVCRACHDAIHGHPPTARRKSQ